MNSHKKENNIKIFEQRISNAIIALLLVASTITTILFLTIFYQAHLQHKVSESKEIDNTISLFQYNLSEKLSIIASSNIFIDFLTSGSSTRKELELQFLTELFPLRSSGVIGYSLVNSQTRATYQSGIKSDQSLTLKLCYLSNKLDNINGNCFGSIKLFFAKNKVVSELSRINGSIKSCINCKQYSLIKNKYFGNFFVAEQTNFYAKIFTNIEHENIAYYYVIIIIILFGFALFNKAKLRKIINETISNPLHSLVQSIKAQYPMENNPMALQEINYLSAEIESGRIQISKINEYEKKAALGYLAATVAHDIRSPLAVMEISMSKISNSLPASHFTMLNQAIQSVRDIANNLLVHYRNSPNESNSFIEIKNNNPPTLQDSGNDARLIVLTPLLELIISQKRHEWQKLPCKLGLIIHLKSKFSWIETSPNDFKRIISNLLNNAYESLENIRSIQVKITFSKNTLKVLIKDTGHGIEKDKIEGVLKGKSYKHPGEGLGLISAKKYMESVNGSLKISSIKNKGTLISLSFPVQPKPIWCPDAITLFSSNIIIIVDDDASIHNYWRHRIHSLGLRTQHFSNSQSFFEWRECNREIDTKAIYFIDYELKSESLNGLEIFGQLNAESRGYLVTSHADEIIIQEMCTQLKLFLIPKSLIDAMKISIED